MVSRAGAEGAASHKQTTEDDEYDRIHALTDSMHKVRAVRADSIFNGADDGGSGTVALLEIAEGFAKGVAKPRRSILFVWHTSAESNPALAGSNWFVDHPTVPRDSIVAELGVDMIGHGEATDEIGITMDEEPRHGNPDYVGLIGPHRLSAELGTLIEAANTEAGLGLRFDRAGDLEGHPDGLYCRNDLSSYARYGIPVAFFTTGFHVDFREVTDEPQYIRYQHMARIVRLVSASALKLANLDHRPALDRPKPDPKARCTP
jgi:Zn-dependent M28 family amino/carboxypeptidase